MWGPGFSPGPEFVGHANSNILRAPLIPWLQGPPDAHSLGIFPGPQLSLWVQVPGQDWQVG